jgi:hypothetical protein
MSYNWLLARQWRRLLGWVILAVVSAPFALHYLGIYYEMLKGKT